MVFAVEDEKAVSDDIDSKQETIEMDADAQQTTDEVSVSSVVTKKKSTAYNLDFEAGDEQMAVKWFERFNDRKPNEEESERIKQFVAVDDDDEMVDIE